MRPKLKSAWLQRASAKGEKGGLTDGTDESDFKKVIFFSWSGWRFKGVGTGTAKRSWDRWKNPGVASEHTRSGTFLRLDYPLTAGVSACICFFFSFHAPSHGMAIPWNPIFVATYFIIDCVAKIPPCAQLEWSRGWPQPATHIPRMNGKTRLQAKEKMDP